MGKPVPGSCDQRSRSATHNAQAEHEMPVFIHSATANVVITYMMLPTMCKIPMQSSTWCALLQRPDNGNCVERGPRFHLALSPVLEVAGRTFYDQLVVKGGEGVPEYVLQAWLPSMLLCWYSVSWYAGCALGYSASGCVGYVAPESEYAPL